MEDAPPVQNEDASTHSAATKDKDVERAETFQHLQRGSITDFTRRGTWVTASAHVITAVIGAGVLSLSYAISWLGWVAGPIFILVFAFITLYTAQLLADMYCYNGKRHRTYQSVVQSVFGRRGGIAIACIQYINLVLTAVSYNITGTTSLQTLVQNQCRHNGTADCWDSYWPFAAMFGGVQILFSQLPNLDSAWWASAIATVMSFGYSFIALGLSIAKGNTHGTVGGRDASPSDKAFGMFNALGAIVFAFSFSFILIDIEDTIGDRPGMSATDAMKKATNVSMAVITSFFMAVGVSGYLAFGDAVPDNIITAFTSPLWLIQMANVMVLVHMIPAYQVFSQPVFMEVERWAETFRWLPEKISGLAFRIAFRSGYCIAVAVTAMALPFFGDMVGLVGALGFWPATIFFPIEMYRRVYKPSRKVLWLLETVNVFSFLVTILAIIGSVQSIIKDASSYSFFS